MLLAEPGVFQLVISRHSLDEPLPGKLLFGEGCCRTTGVFLHLHAYVCAASGTAACAQDFKNVLYTAAGENGPTWSLWQKAPGETRGRPLGFWSRGYRGSEAHYTPTEKEILATYEGV